MTAATKRPAGRPDRGVRGWPIVHARLQPETYEALQALAAAGGLAVSALVADVVAAHVRAATGPGARARRSREARHAAISANVAADRERREIPDDQ